MLTVRIIKDCKEYTVCGVRSFTNDNESICLFFSHRQAMKMSKRHADGSPVEVYFIDGADIEGVYQSSLDASYNKLDVEAIMY